MIPATPAQLASLLALVRKRDKGSLALLITLLESTAASHRKIRLLARKKIVKGNPSSIRVGISGVPGAGKSSLIEKIGLHLCAQGRRVAVLSVDPSSPLSGGSILGDKTRMADLARHPLAFVRPSPSGGLLGGIAARTKEALLACETAGYEIILVETVGVGQSEAAVRALVDCLLFVAVTGGGDELQNMKRGLLELTDIVAVNKADGANRAAAEKLALELRAALTLFPTAIPDWKRPLVLCSALEGKGIAESWEAVEQYLSALKSSIGVKKFRAQQEGAWFESLVREKLFEKFSSSTRSRKRYDDLKKRVQKGALSAPLAIEELFK